MPRVLFLFFADGYGFALTWRCSYHFGGAADSAEFLSKHRYEYPRQRFVYATGAGYFAGRSVMARPTVVAHEPDRFGAE